MLHFRGQKNTKQIMYLDFISLNLSNMVTKSVRGDVFTQTILLSVNRRLWYTVLWYADELKLHTYRELITVERINKEQINEERINKIVLYLQNDRYLWVS